MTLFQFSINTILFGWFLIGLYAVTRDPWHVRTPSRTLKLALSTILLGSVLLTGDYISYKLGY